MTKYPSPMGEGWVRANFIFLALHNHPPPSPSPQGRGILFCPLTFGERVRDGLVIRRPEGQRAGRQARIGAAHESNLFAGSARRKQPDLLTS